MTRPVARPGSSLPSCRTYVSGPLKVATVITEPSGSGIRVTVTRGGTGRGRTTGDAVARMVAVALACRDGDDPDGTDGAAGCELHAATVSRTASATVILRIIGSGSWAAAQACGYYFGHYGNPHREPDRLGPDFAVKGRAWPSRPPWPRGPAAGDHGQRLIARGLGRSYGDAAQSDGGAVTDTARLDPVLDVDLGHRRGDGRAG